MVDVLELSTVKKSREGARMPLMAPGQSGEVLTHTAKGRKTPKEMYLILLGPESLAVRKAIARIQAKSEQESDPEDLTEEQLEAERLADARTLASVTVGGEVFMKGKWVKVTEEVAEELYFQVAAFRAQATKFCLDLGNFRGE